MKLMRCLASAETWARKHVVGVPKGSEGMGPLPQGEFRCSWKSLKRMKTDHESGLPSQGKPRSWEGSNKTAKVCGLGHYGQALYIENQNQQILFHLYWSRIVGTTNGVASCRLCIVQVPRYLPFALQVLAQLPGKQTALVAMTVSEWHGYLMCQPVQKKQMFGWKAWIHLIYPLLLLQKNILTRHIFATAH